MNFGNSFQKKKKGLLQVENLQHLGFGVPGRIRTAGSLLRRQILYPAEVRRHIWLLERCS